MFTSRNRRSAVLVAVVGLAAATVLGGCSSSGGTSGTPHSSDRSSAAAAVAATAKAAAAPAAATHASGKLINVCTTLPIAKVSQITGTKFTTARADTIGSMLTKCAYGGGTNQLDVSVQVQAGKLLLDSDVAAMKSVHHGPKPLSGVGDAAFTTPNPNGNAGSIGAAAFASFGVVFGQTYIRISGLSWVNAKQGTEIAEILHAAA